MTRRMKVLAIVVLAVLLGSILAIEVQAGKQDDFYSPGGKPYDSALVMLTNHSSELYVYADVYFENEDGYEYGPCRLWVAPMETGYGMLHDACCGFGGAVHVRIENFYQKDVNNWTGGVMWVAPCPYPWEC